MRHLNEGSPWAPPCAVSPVPVYSDMGLRGFQAKLK
jgi:hypothetical protein